MECHHLVPVYGMGVHPRYRPDGMGCDLWIFHYSVGRNHRCVHGSVDEYQRCDDHHLEYDHLCMAEHL